jgi:hypothetical protein
MGAEIMSMPDFTEESGVAIKITIPVIADSLPREAWNDLARCVYFTIIADDPSTMWGLSLDGLSSVPFLMLGLEGIIFRPVRPDESDFTSPQLLQELIDAVESLEGFSVETEYFWLPTKLLDAAFSATIAETPDRSSADRGSVFRVSHRLFTEALRAAREGTGLDHFSRVATDQIVGEVENSAIRYSPVETMAIREWSERQVRANENFRR